MEAPTFPNFTSIRLLAFSVQEPWVFDLIRIIFWSSLGLHFLVCFPRSLRDSRGYVVGLEILGFGEFYILGVSDFWGLGGCWVAGVGAWAAFFCAVLEALNFKKGRGASFAGRTRNANWRPC